MYSNVGKKIMDLATICGWITFVCGVLIWLGYIADGSSYNNSVGWIWLGVGVAGFISSWPLYGFGQIVDDIHAMRNQAPASATQNDELPEL